MPDHHRLSVVAWIVCRHNTRIVYSTAASKYVWGFSHYVENHPHFHLRLWSLHFEFHLCFVFLFSILQTHKRAVPCGVCFWSNYTYRLFKNKHWRWLLRGDLRCIVSHPAWSDHPNTPAHFISYLCVDINHMYDISVSCELCKRLDTGCKGHVHQTERATKTRMIMLLRRLKLHCKWTVIGRCTSHIAQYVAE